MHLRSSEESHRCSATAHPVRHEELSPRLPVEIEQPARVLPVEWPAGHEDRHAPRCRDLSAVGVTTQREVELAVTDVAQTFWRMHEHDARSRYTVYRQVRARTPARRVGYAADGDVVEGLGQTQRFVIEHADAGVREAAKDRRAVGAQIVIPQHRKLA